MTKVRHGGLSLYFRHIARSVGQYGLFAFFLSLSACGSSESERNLKPGDADYPVENPRPEHIVQFTAVVPASLPVEFKIGYVASSLAGSMQNGTACASTVGLGVARSYSILLAPVLSKQGDVYRGEITLDRYLPGRCGWKFAGVWYVVPNESSNQRELFFADKGDRGIASGKAHVWCIKSVKLNPKFPEACMSIKGLLIAFPELVSQDDYESIKTSGSDIGAPIHLGNEPKSVAIQFHDMNATDGDRANRLP